MRLITGKPGSPKLQEMIQNKKTEIYDAIKEWHKQEEHIHKLMGQWHVMTESERASNDEEWMMSDQLEYGKMEYQMLSKGLRFHGSQDSE